MTRRPRTIGDVEALEAAKLFRDHGERLERYRVEDRAEREAAALGPVVGASRHAAELEARARLRRELEAALDQPLHVACLTPDERAAIRAHELARRGWRDDAPTRTVRG